jgi:mRNA interferase MazF
VRRGDIWWADMGEPAGSIPGFRRPVLIVQDDLLNESRLQTVMVVPLTSNLRRSEAAGNALLQPRETGLDRPSVALVCQVMTIERAWLSERVGNLSQRGLRRVDLGLRLALGLSIGS